jgi:hypothetical protein
MSIERRSKLWSGPPIVPADPATEREQLIAANHAFAAALKRALQSGAETSVGVLATVIRKPGKSGTASGFAARRRVETIGADSGRYRTEDAARKG